MEITDSFTHINVDSGQLVDRDRILSPGEETVRERENKKPAWLQIQIRVDPNKFPDTVKKNLKRFGSIWTGQYSSVKLTFIYNSAKHSTVVLRKS